MVHLDAYRIVQMMQLATPQASNQPVLSAFEQWIHVTIAFHDSPDPRKAMLPG